MTVFESKWNSAALEISEFMITSRYSDDLTIVLKPL
jgi:hypothetical protein